MKRWMLACFTMLTMLMVVAGAIAGPTAAQGNSEAAHDCQGEGYLAYTDADDNGFKNAGQCTSYAAQGGDLVPIPTAEVGIIFVQTDPFGGDVQFTGSGLEPGSAVLWSVYGYINGDPDAIGDVVGYAGANGDFHGSLGFACGYYTSAEVSGTAADGSTVSDTAVLPC